MLATPILEDDLLSNLVFYKSYLYWFYFSRGRDPHLVLPIFWRSYIHNFTAMFFLDSYLLHYFGCLLNLYIIIFWLKAGLLLPSNHPYRSLDSVSSAFYNCPTLPLIHTARTPHLSTSCKKSFLWLGNHSFHAFSTVQTANLYSYRDWKYLSLHTQQAPLKRLSLLFAVNFFACSMSFTTVLTCRSFYIHSILLTRAFMVETFCHSYTISYFKLILSHFLQPTRQFY